jgi:CheY-like chemotaxis protein
LAISKRLAQLLGGDIEVQSTPGQGSQFSLVLDPGPLDQVPLREYLGEGVRSPETTPPDAPPPRLPAGCRILLAEDGPDNRRLISHILQKAGAEVATVENGAMAVETLLPPEPDAHQPTFDIVLMDMQMPVLDGYRATRQLRSAGYVGPIIAVTAHAMKTDRTKCLDAGCDDYVAKPIDRRRLLETVCAHLGRPGIQSPSGLVK